MWDALFPLYFPPEVAEPSSFAGFFQWAMRVPPGLSVSNAVHVVAWYFKAWEGGETNAVAARVSMATARKKRLGQGLTMDRNRKER